MAKLWPNGEKTVTEAPRVLVVEDETNIRELVCLHWATKATRATASATEARLELARRIDTTFWSST